MATRNELMLHAAPLPAHITLQPGALSGVDAVTPLLLTIYNSDEEARTEMSSFCKGNSQNGGVHWDKARVVQKVRAVNAKSNGGNPMITEANDATLGRWCEWGQRRLDGIARSKRLAQAKANLLAASQAQADDQSDD